jgi:outer membrane protein OmpA-like peptidoglycan-associated protein
MVDDDRSEMPTRTTRSSGRSSLRSWDDVRQPVQIVAASERRRDGNRAGWWIALSLLAIGGAAVGGYLVGQHKPATVKTEIVTITVPVSASVPITTVVPALSTTVVPSTTVAASTTTPAPPTTVALPVPAGDVVRPSAMYEGGKLVLKGSQPSQAAVDALVAHAAVVVGAENVVTQYVLDPRVTVSFGGTVTVVETIHFDAGGVELTAESKELLDRVASLLLKAPSAYVVANSYTDSQGDELRNIGLAKQRVDAVAAYWEGKGIAADRVVPAARGKANPVADNATTEGRAQNRRIELTVYGLLD